MTICGHCGEAAIEILRCGDPRCTACGSRRCIAPSLDEIEAVAAALRTGRRTATRYGGDAGSVRRRDDAVDVRAARTRTYRFGQRKGLGVWFDAL